jgi:3-hydroxyisobutyrate dehydrogenase-like beta-hydroxyacid dehydrogenase
MTTVTVIASGEMGAGVGGRLNQRGARVLTSLNGRSAGSAARAGKAGMIPVENDADLVAQSDFILSIVPPGDAIALARRLAPPLKASGRKPVYVDCNAVSAETTIAVGAIIAETGCEYVDAGIIGGPPSGHSPGPRLYASGAAAAGFERLKSFGLDVRTLDAPIGAASALKMSYAGITKGLSAIASAMIVSASRAGVADALHAELAHSQAAILEVIAGNIPRMFPKAYRFVAEMEEIAAYAQDTQGARNMYEGAARLYQRVADGVAAQPPGDEVARLAGFFGGAPKVTAK